VLKGLQTLRFFAALLVIVEHAAYYSSLATVTDIGWFLKLNIGGLGVYLFFCISGAVMSLASNTTASQFLTRRVVRIYPPYLMALGLSALLLWIVTGGAKPSMSFELSLLLVPTHSLDASYQIPYWTLIYEMFFYAWLYLMLAFRLSAKSRAWCMVAWSLGIVLVASFIELKNPAFANALGILISPLNLYFAAGYVLMYSLSSKDQRPLVALIITIAFFSTMYLASIRYIFVSSLLACGLIHVAASLRGLPRWATTPGDWSYGIYLLHMPPMYMLYFHKVGGSFLMALPIYLIAGAAVGVTFGILEYWLHRTNAIQKRLPQFFSSKAWTAPQSLSVAAGEDAVG
jgi:peptidoglycan/LPS O-acetylase OafA/YrhL